MVLASWQQAAVEVRVARGIEAAVAAAAAAAVEVGAEALDEVVEVELVEEQVAFHKPDSVVFGQGIEDNAELDIQTLEHMR